MFEPGCLRRGIFVAAAFLPLLFSAGCQQPLAVHDPYFRSGNTTAAAQGAEARRVVRYRRALQTARRSCPTDTSAEAGSRDGPVPADKAGRAALAALCADLREPSTAAHGGTLNAYRRWVEDRIRELPEAAATGAGAAGGS